MALPMTSTTSSFDPSLLPLRSRSARRGGRGDGNNIIACALRRDASFGHGRLVDENMIVLRMRIHEIKMRDDDVAPSDWMDWEKKYFHEKYDSDICEAVGVLQSHLMNTRPALALAALAMLSLSVPISMGVLLLHLADVAKEVMVGFHL